MAITFGNVPHPENYEQRLIDNGNQLARYDQAVGRDNVGTCVHRMEGTLTGTDDHFRQPTTEALTDYGIGGALDGPSLDGWIYMWNDPTGTTVPSANGPTSGPGSNPRGDGPAFLSAYPGQDVNSLLVSIELSGQQTTEVTPAQFESLCQLIAHWHDQAEVPWDQFPLNPASGVVTQMQHWEFSAKECPFVVVRGMTTEYQDRVREIMRSYQETTVPPPSGDYGKADIVRTSEAMNLRSGPGSGATVTGTIPQNAILVLEGPSDYRDGAWWFQHRSHWGYGWSTDRFTEYANVQNFSRNPGGDQHVVREIGGGFRIVRSGRQVTPEERVVVLHQDGPGGCVSQAGSRNKVSV